MWLKGMKIELIVDSFTACTQWFDSIRLPTVGFTSVILFFKYKKEAFANWPPIFFMLN